MVKKFFLPLLVLLVLFSGIFTVNDVSSQATNQWSTPRRIPNYNLVDRAPYMIADQNRTIHAFNNGNVSSTMGAIFYRRWSPEQGWSPPVDVLVSPLASGLQTIQGVFIDHSGVIHLTFATITETSGDIYYTRALASIADRAAAWSTPVIIATDAGPLAFGGLTGDGEGKLLALFGAEGAGNGLYEAHSFDGGESWSHPRALSLIYQRGQYPASIRTEIDPQGNVHVVWGVMNERGVGEEVRYARLNSDYSDWNFETVLARREGDEYSTTWPSIISTQEGTLIVIYQDSFPATRWMRLSSDGGQTWSLAARPFEHIGEYENAVLLKDSLGNVHMVLGNRIGNPATHGMWYSRWLGRNWTPLVALTSGPVTRTYDPSAPQGVVVQGNILMATWWHNVRREDLSGAWYSYIYLDVPETPRVPLPSPTPIPSPTPFELEISEITPVPGDGLPQFPIEDDTPGNPGLPVYISVIPVVVLIPVVIILYRKKIIKR